MQGERKDVRMGEEDEIKLIFFSILVTTEMTYGYIDI